MKNFLAVTILALAGAACAVPAVTFLQLNSNMPLVNYMMKPEVYAVGPTVTAQCFNLYLPIVNQIASTFSTQYQACINIAQQRLQSLNVEAQGNETYFMTVTSNICSAYQNCNAQAAQVVDFFGCYANVSNADVSVIYNLGLNATAAANSFSQSVQSIQNDEEQCTSVTEQTYINDTATTYSLLDLCLQNGLPTITTGGPSDSTEPTLPDFSDVTDNFTDNFTDDFTGTTLHAVTL